MPLVDFYKIVGKMNAGTFKAGRDETTFGSTTMCEIL